MRNRQPSDARVPGTEIANSLNVNHPGRTLSWRAFLIALYRSWQKDQVGDVAAALTFYGVLSLFPFLLFLVSLTGWLLNAHATDELVGELGRVAPAEVTQIINNRLTGLVEHGHSGKWLAVGIVAAIWTASGAIVSLMRALNRLYGVEETRPLWKRRALAVGVTLGAGALGLAAATVTVLAPAVRAIAGADVSALVTWLRFPAAGLIMLFIWAAMYWLLPDIKTGFHWITFGSAVGVGLWLIASWGFSEYVRRSHKFDITYGALGGVIVLLVWMWLSSVMLLLGAEIDKVLRAGAEATTPPARPAPSPDRDAPPPSDGDRSRAGYAH